MLMQCRKCGTHLQEIHLPNQTNSYPAWICPNKVCKQSNWPTSEIISEQILNEALHVKEKRAA